MRTDRWDAGWSIGGAEHTGELGSFMHTLNLLQVA
jgi:hypothetical protein